MIPKEANGNLLVSTPAVLLLAATTIASVAAATTGLFSTTNNSRAKSEQLRSQLIFWGRCNTYIRLLLKNVRVPVALLDKDEADVMKVDDEGLVALKGIWIYQGKIQALQQFNESTIPTNTGNGGNPFFVRTIDCQGAIVMTCFVDAHTHLIKTQTVPRNRNYAGTINEALEAEACDRPNWKDKGDIYRRMEFAVQSAIHYGSRAIRTHLDGCGEDEDRALKSVAYQAFDDIQAKYKDTLVIQGVANLFLPLWLDKNLATRHAKEASRHQHVVLGAYVGGTPGIEPHDETIQAMDELFAHAHSLKMDVDLHIDESNNPDSLALSSLCVSLAKARQKGYTGKVVLGHCCGLSLQDSDTQKRICQQLYNLGNVHVVANPFTNLGLQDRKGSKPPYCSEIPDNTPRTPQWRGLTLVQELRAGGVNVSSASDNVRDHWYPYGDYDLLSVWKDVQALGHLDTDPSEGAWANLITTSPANAMGLAHNGFLRVNAPADLVLFPQARRISELFSRPQTDRIVLRQGQVQKKVALPDFCELDDLVAVKTERNGQQKEAGLGAF